MKNLLLVFLCGTSLLADAQQTTTPLKISTISTWEGTLGSVTFSQSKKTVFYFDRNENKGKIILNNKTYVLTSEKIAKSGYIISGNGITINAPNCKYKPENGGDCSYGNCATITVKLNTSSLTLKNVDVQDCPVMAD